MASSVLVMGASGAAGVACKSGDKASKKAEKTTTKPVVSAKDDSAKKDLIARRDSLLRARARILERRKQLRAELKKDGNTVVVKQKFTALRKDEDTLIEDQARFIQKYDEYLKKQQRIIASLNATPRSQSERLVAREGVLAARENSVAGREGRVGKREAALGERELKVAKREQLECAVGGSTTTIVRIPDKAGARTRRDVDPLLQGAQRLMSRRGILTSDLSAPARRLLRDARTAMRKRNYTKAYYTARTLFNVVRSTRINKMFIKGKMSRLSRYIRKKRLRPSTQRKVDTLFRQATRSYGDGRFTRANSRLNRIYGVIR